MAGLQPGSAVMTRPSPPPIDRLVLQLGVIRQLARDGLGSPAKRLCGVLFLDHLMPIVREPPLLRGFVECLLLLEMTALLPRLLRAAFGVDLDMARPCGPTSRHWLLSFSNGIALLVPTAASLRQAGPELAAEWAARVITVAAAEAPLQAEPAARRACSRPLTVV